MANYKKNIIISIVGLIVFAVVSVSLTFSWFRDYSINVGTMNQIEVYAGDMLVISTDGTNFSRSFSLSYPNTLLKDVTGDGATFIVPERVNQNNQTEHGISYSNIHTAIVSENRPATTAVSTLDSLEDADYISVNLTFKSASKMDVYLSSDSYVSPVATDLTGEGGTITNASNYGDFSRDGIAGATRVSIVDDEDNVVLYWIPNSNYQLTFGPVTEIVEEQEVTSNKWSFNPEGVAEDDESIEASQRGYFYYQQGTSALEKHSVTNYTKTLPTITLDTTELPEGATPIAALTYDEDNKVYTASVTVNIWIEGCDREARRALAGGKLDVQLLFLGFASEESAS